MACPAPLVVVPLLPTTHLPLTFKPFTFPVVVLLAGGFTNTPVRLPWRAPHSQLAVPSYHDDNRFSLVSPASGVLEAPSVKPASLRP